MADALGTIVALDLGSTRIKAAALGAGAALSRITVRQAPPIRGRDPIRESDPEAYRHAVETLLDDLVQRSDGALRIGIACQRSTFLLWDRRTGAPRTPLISWQDRRARSWCDRNAVRLRDVTERTGLPLSPHYAAPKLAALLDDNPSWRADAEAGVLLFGTLESWLLWHWSDGACHETDLSMAARTQLVDLVEGDWAPVLLAAFGVPRRLLPDIVATGRDRPLSGRYRIFATVADQSAAALAVPDGTLVNLGTGGFVLRPTGQRLERRAGFLSAPMVTDISGRMGYGLEATINGLVAALAGVDTGPPAPPSDVEKDAFCLPDSTGVGSPFWLSDMPALLSVPRQTLPAADLKRAVFEGIVFRIRQCLDGIGGSTGRIVLSGGLVGTPYASALAACLGRPVELSLERELTLLGTALLAPVGGRHRRPPTRLIEPSDTEGALAPRYVRWRAWADDLVATFRREGVSGLAGRAFALAGRPVGAAPDKFSTPEDSRNESR